MTHFMRPFVKPIRYMPTFVGTSDSGEKIVLYKDIIKNSDEVFIKIDGGEVQKVSDGSDMLLEFDNVNAMYVLALQSPEWTGNALGSKRALLEEEPIR
jgi:hypothetical protein